MLDLEKLKNQEPFEIHPTKRFSKIVHGGKVVGFADMPLHAGILKDCVMYGFDQASISGDILIIYNALVMSPDMEDHGVKAKHLMIKTNV